MGKEAAIKIVAEAKSHCLAEPRSDLRVRRLLFCFGSTLMTTWGDAKRLHGWAARGRYARVWAYVRTFTHSRPVGRCRHPTVKPYAGSLHDSHDVHCIAALLCTGLLDVGLRLDFDSTRRGTMARSVSTTASSCRRTNVGWSLNCFTIDSGQHVSDC